MAKQISDYSNQKLPGIWDVLTKRQIEFLKSCSHLQFFKRHEMVYCNGDAPTHLLCLLGGKIKIFKEGIGGRSQITQMIKPIEYFGYRAFFAEELYATSARAVDTSVVYMIPVEVIMELIKKNSDLAIFFIKAMAVDLGIANTRTVNLTQKHVQGRLAEALLSLVRTYGVSEDSTLNIYLSREDLASFSNMTASNATRTLSTFANEKIITVDGRKIKILDEYRLMKISRIG